MSIWLCIPSARPDGGSIPKWRAAGYKTCIWRDPGAPFIDSEIIVVGQYCGYPAACNALIRRALQADSECDWVVCAGDDIFPCHLHPDTLSIEFSKYFGARHGLASSTLGVVQGIGDRWGENPTYHDPAMRGAYIDRIAGSPFIGRDYAERMYRGLGPWCEEYTHMGCDEEFREVAIMNSLYWERQDLTHYHDHWGRPLAGERHVRNAQIPDFLKEANSAEHWKKYKDTFRRRNLAGFPGHEPTPIGQEAK